MNRTLTSITGRLVLTAMTVMALTACSDDKPEPTVTETGDLLRLVTYNRTYSEPGEGILTTRAGGVPDGYVPFATLHPETEEGQVSIGVFLTPPAASETLRLGLFTYQGNNQWASTVGVKQSNYYIYGFMPTDAVEDATVTSAAYDQGATLTLKGLSAVTPSDVSVVVGVQGVTSLTDTKNVQVGQFGYTGRETDNLAYLLLDHLFAAIQLNMKVSTAYDKVRTIRLRRLELKTDMASTFDAAITLQRGTGISNVSWTKTAGSTTATLYLNEEGMPLSATETKTIMACIVPEVSGNSFTLVSTYNVYDKKGNLVREGCTSENRVNTIPVMVRGEKTVLNMTVNPTYLYQLSEPDLENPTMNIES